MKKRLRIEYFLLRQSCFYYLSEVLRRPIFLSKEMVAQQETYLRRKIPF